MIIYIHGFGGSGEGNKATILRKLFSSHRFIAPSLPYVPKLAINTLKELISTFIENEHVYLIGSSLGGYYTIYLADYFNIPAVLINPSVNPTNTLKQSLGYAPNFFDNSNFQWTTNHLEMLKEYEVNNIKTNIYILLTQKGDELLNYKEAVEKLENSKMIIEDGGNHGYVGIHRHIDTIKQFFIETNNSNCILKYIEEIGYHKFIQAVPLSHIAIAMHWFNKDIQHAIFDSMSQRVQIRLQEELELIETPTIDEIKEILIQIEDMLEKELLSKE